MAPERRQIIIVAVLAGLLVALFFLGVGFGVTRGDPVGAVDSWMTRLERFGQGKSVDPAQLQAAGGCSINAAARQVQLTGPCQIKVPAVGRFAVRGSRGLVIAPANESITFATVVEDKGVNGTISAGDNKKLVFGRKAAVLELVCVGPSPCAIDLPE